MTLQSNVRRKAEESKKVTRSFSLDPEVAEALDKAANEGPYKVPTSRIVSEALRQFFGLTKQKNPDDV